MSDSSLAAAPPAMLDKLCERSGLAAALAHLPRPWVFTNGVFDVLHRGHVVYLAQARALGGSLIVALNTDASTRRLGKGDDRPLNNEMDRAIVMARQEAGECIVFTNGCFDILHAGHVRYLAQARVLGDRLVVGLNADSSVKRLKGEARPVNVWDDRATVLSALGSVDWVLPFGDNAVEQDSPLQLIMEVNPHVLVKGGDYHMEVLPETALMHTWGGKALALPFVSGYSTTALVKKILAQGR